MDGTSIGVDEGSIKGLKEGANKVDGKNGTSIEEDLLVVLCHLTEDDLVIVVHILMEEDLGMVVDMLME